VGRGGKWHPVFQRSAAHFPLTQPAKIIIQIFESLSSDEETAKNLAENPFFKLEHETRDKQAAKRVVPSINQLLVQFFFSSQDKMLLYVVKWTLNCFFLAQKHRK